jgi:chromosome segregation ATPase
MAETNAVLIKCIKQLEANYQERLSRIIEYYQMYEYNKREYEWIIRKLSAQQHKEHAEEPSSFEKYPDPPNTSLHSKSMESLLENLNEKLADDFRLVSTQLSASEDRARSLQESLDSERKKYEAKYEEYQSTIAQLKNDIGSLQAHLENSRQQLKDSQQNFDLKLQDMMLALNDTKQLNFIQTQEIAHLYSAQEEMRNRSNVTVGESAPTSPNVSQTDDFQLFN